MVSHRFALIGILTYNALFQTDPDGWRLVYIPYAGMVPTFRGYRMDINALDRRPSARSASC